MGKSQNTSKKLDYKWVIVGLCFLMVMTALGFCSSIKGKYVNPVSTALEIERSKYLFTNTFRSATTAILNLFFGTLIAKFGTKKLISAGFLSLIASCIVNSFATNVYMIYAGGVLLGIGLAWTTTAMVSCVVNKWCKENKGTIMGLVLASNGIGGVIAAQTIVPVITKSAEGFRDAYRLVAVILSAVLLIILIFFRERPKNSTEETTVTKKKARGQSWEGISFADARKKVYFYVAILCILVTGFVLAGVQDISYDHMEIAGVDIEFITLIMSAHSISLAGFKFLTGFLYDKLGLRKTMNICSVAAMISMISLALVTGSKAGATMAMVYGIVSSLALPLETIMIPIYASDLFGQKSFEQILGIFVSVNTLGLAIGSPIMGWCYDKFGSYKPMLICASVAMLISIITMQFVLNAAKKTRYEVERRGIENA